MRNTRWMPALLAIVMGLVGLAPLAEAQAPPKVKYMLSSKKGTPHYPATLAEHLGFFKDEGFDIEVLPGSGSGGMIRR